MMNNMIIEVKELTAKYNNNTVLDKISVGIPRNKITVVLGSSGCGKTTLIKNIFRLYPPFSGSVKIMGKEITLMDELEYEQILKEVGMLFQNGALINSLSIFDNIAIPLQQHTDLPDTLIERMIKVKLDLVNLGHAAKLMPSELSGGMKKRAALARAIIMDPEILVCDEPSAGLDPLTSAALDKLILKLKETLDMTILIVTHELASIHRIADNLIFLDTGKVVFNGSLVEAKKSNIEQVKTFFEVGKF